jgi:hypothetical protein
VLSRRRSLLTLRGVRRLRGSCRTYDPSAASLSSAHASAV